MSVPTAPQQVKQTPSPRLVSAHNDHGATVNLADEHSDDYREPTKQEVLDGIARSYRQALAGEYEPIEELIAELE